MNGLIRLPLRLVYLPQIQIQVPHCEILMANTAAKSNIRAGPFSQLVSTVQSGGEDGMWSFERYSRWIATKRDWVRPSQATPLDERSEIPVAPDSCPSTRSTTPAET
ncbi:hypothetical protein WDW86_16625 [Bdellovibrionota bacterium FG-2]